LEQLHGDAVAEERKRRAAKVYRREGEEKGSAGHTSAERSEAWKAMSKQARGKLQAHWINVTQRITKNNFALFLQK
jgi:hypothetical protein